MAAAVSALARDGGVAGSAPRTTRLLWLIFSLLCLLCLASGTQSDLQEKLQALKTLLRNQEHKIESFKEYYKKEHSITSELNNGNQLRLNYIQEMTERGSPAFESHQPLIETIKASVEKTKADLQRMDENYAKMMEDLQEKLMKLKEAVAIQEWTHNEL